MKLVVGIPIVQTPFRDPTKFISVRLTTFKMMPHFLALHDLRHSNPSTRTVRMQFGYVCSSPHRSVSVSMVHCINRIQVTSSADLHGPARQPTRPPLGHTKLDNVQARENRLR
jgi:hypothetical protein